MKTRNPPRWYVEWDKETRHYAVRKGGFQECIRKTKVEALQRVVELEELEKQRNENDRT